MLHDLDLFSLQDIQNNIDRACESWRSSKGFGQEAVGSGVATGAAARPFRKFFDCEKLSPPPWRGTKGIQRTRIAVTPGARREVPGLAQR